MCCTAHAHRRPEAQHHKPLEGLSAEVVIVDIAYDADHLREDIAAKKAIAVIPNNPSRALKYRKRSAEALQIVCA